jgi:hypothetical protein
MSRRFVLMLLAILAAVPCVAAQNGTPPASPARAAPVADSLPSDVALQVLGRIPEPLTAAQQTAAPARRAAAPVAGRNAVPSATPMAGAPSVALVPAPAPTAPSPRDSARASEGSGDVPVPAPTQPVTVPSSPTLVMPDTLPPVRTTPTLDAPTSAAGSWCVQVAAPEERAKAESRRDAAQSLLLLPFVIETELGLHKVRTRDGWTREAADAIKQRALGCGFEGVFLVDRAAVGAPTTPTTKPAAKPAAKPRSTAKSTKPRARKRTR